MVEKEVIKVELPKPLAEKFRRYVAERYGLRKGALSTAVAELIEKALGEPASEGVDAIVGLGLESAYRWEGEDLVEALRGAYASRGRERGSRGAVQED